MPEYRPPDRARPVQQPPPPPPPPLVDATNVSRSSNPEMHENSVYVVEPTFTIEAKPNHRNPSESMANSMSGLFSLDSCCDLASPLKASNHGSKIMTGKTFDSSSLSKSLSNIPKRLVHIGPVISEGASTVYKAMWRGFPIALRRTLLGVNMSKRMGQEHCTQIEIAITASNQHPNLLKIITYMVGPVSPGANATNPWPRGTIIEFVDHRGTHLQDQLWVNAVSASQSLVLDLGPEQGVQFEVLTIMELCDLGSLSKMQKSLAMSLVPKFPSQSHCRHSMGSPMAHPNHPNLPSLPQPAPTLLSPQVRRSSSFYPEYGATYESGIGVSTLRASTSQPSMVHAYQALGLIELTEVAGGPSLDNSSHDNSNIIIRTSSDVQFPLPTVRELSREPPCSIRPSGLRPRFNSTELALSVPNRDISSNTHVGSSDVNTMSAGLDTHNSGSCPRPMSGSTTRLSSQSKLLKLSSHPSANQLPMSSQATASLVAPTKQLSCTPRHSSQLDTAKDTANDIQLDANDINYIQLEATDTANDIQLDANDINYIQLEATDTANDIQLDAYDINYIQLEATDTANDIQLDANGINYIQLEATDTANNIQLDANDINYIQLEATDTANDIQLDANDINYIQLEATDTANNIQLDTANGTANSIQLDTANNIQLDTANNIQLDTANNIQLDTANNIQLDTANNIQLETANDIQLHANDISYIQLDADDTANDIQLDANDTANDIQMETNDTANDIQMDTANDINYIQMDTANDTANNIQMDIANDAVNDIQLGAYDTANDIQLDANETANNIQLDAYDTANDIQPGAYDTANDIQLDANNTANEIPRELLSACPNTDDPPLSFKDIAEVPRSSDEPMTQYTSLNRSETAVTSIQSLEDLSEARCSRQHSPRSINEALTQYTNLSRPETAVTSIDSMEDLSKGQRSRPHSPRSIDEPPTEYSNLIRPETAVTSIQSLEGLTKAQDMPDLTKAQRMQDSTKAQHTQDLAKAQHSTHEKPSQSERLSYTTTSTSRQSLQDIMNASQGMKATSTHLEQLSHANNTNSSPTSFQDMLDATRSMTSFQDMLHATCGIRASMDNRSSDSERLSRADHTSSTWQPLQVAGSACLSTFSSSASDSKRSQLRALREAKKDNSRLLKSVTNADMEDNLKLYQRISSIHSNSMSLSANQLQRAPSSSNRALTSSSNSKLPNRTINTEPWSSGKKSSPILKVSDPSENPVEDPEAVKARNSNMLAVLYAAIDIARALSHLHKKGIIHGHLCPSNILFKSLIPHSSIGPQASGSESIESNAVKGLFGDGRSTSLEVHSLRSTPSYGSLPPNTRQNIAKVCNYGTELDPLQSGSTQGLLDSPDMKAHLAFFVQKTGADLGVNAATSMEQLAHNVGVE
eukprot:gene16222-22387_t